MAEKENNSQVDKNGNDKDEHLLGLKNQGGTCYLNSLLQALFYLPDFRKRLFSFNYDDKKHGSKERNVALQLQTIFAKLQFSLKNYISTKKLTKSFGWNNNQAYQQQDVNEFFVLLLEALDKTFTPVFYKKREEMKRIRNSENPAKSAMEIEEKYKANENLQKEEKEGLVSDLFRGVFEDCIFAKIPPSSQLNQLDPQLLSDASKKEDSGEKKIGRTYLEEFLDLQLNVAGIESVEKSFDDYIKEEEMTQDNQWFCEQLNKKTDAVKFFRFKSFPKILVLNLKRFSFDYKTQERLKIASKMTFPLVLDISKYLPSSNSTIPTEVFELCSVLVHSGNPRFGHYFCYNKVGLKWFCFNDERVTLVDSSEVLSMCGEDEKNEPNSAIKNNKNYSKNAYMLIYTKLDQNEIKNYLKFKSENENNFENFKKNEIMKENKENKENSQKIKKEDQENEIKKKYNFEFKNENLKKFIDEKNQKILKLEEEKRKEANSIKIQIFSGNFERNDSYDVEKNFIDSFSIEKSEKLNEMIKKLNEILKNKEILKEGKEARFFKFKNKNDIKNGIEFGEIISDKDSETILIEYAIGSGKNNNFLVFEVKGKEENWKIYEKYISFFYLHVTPFQNTFSAPIKTFIKPPLTYDSMRDHFSSILSEKYNKFDEKKEKLWKKDDIAFFQLNFKQNSESGESEGLKISQVNQNDIESLTSGKMVYVEVVETGKSPRTTSILNLLFTSFTLFYNRPLETSFDNQIVIEKKSSIAELHERIAKFIEKDVKDLILFDCGDKEITDTSMIGFKKALGDLKDKKIIEILQNKHRIYVEVAGLKQDTINVDFVQYIPQNYQIRKRKDIPKNSQSKNNVVANNSAQGVNSLDSIKKLNFEGEELLNQVLDEENEDITPLKMFNMKKKMFEKTFTFSISFAETLFSLKKKICDEINKNHHKLLTPKMIRIRRNLSYGIGHPFKDDSSLLLSLYKNIEIEKRIVYEVLEKEETLNKDDILVQLKQWDSSKWDFVCPIKSSLNYYLVFSLFNMFSYKHMKDHVSQLLGEGFEPEKFHIQIFPKGVNFTRQNIALLDWDHSDNQVMSSLEDDCIFVIKLKEETPKYNLDKVMMAMFEKNKMVESILSQTNLSEVKEESSSLKKSKSSDELDDDKKKTKIMKGIRAAVLNFDLGDNKSVQKRSREIQMKISTEFDDPLPSKEENKNTNEEGKKEEKVEGKKDEEKEKKENGNSQETKKE